MADLATANMLHRKTRAIVSVLGVALQVATVMILVGLVNGTLESISARLESVGADVIFQPPDASLILGATHTVMPTSLGALMKEKVPAVREATPILNRQVAQLKGNPETINLWAVDYPSYARISGGLLFAEGRAIAGPDELNIDTVIRRKYGFRIGEAVELMGRTFTIVGISQAGSGGAPRPHRGRPGANGTPDMASFFLIKGPPPGGRRPGPEAGRPSPATR
jgi:putative ABC transport system permease protein